MCRRNNTSVKQRSAIKSGYRKCYRTSRIVFCGEQKYWIFYNAIKRLQTITMRWSMRGHRGRREANNEARRFVGLQPRVVSTPLDPIDTDLINHSAERKKTMVSAVAPSLRFPPLMTVSPSVDATVDAESKRRSMPLRTAQNGSLLFRNYRDVGSLLRERSRRTRGEQRRRKREDEERREKEGEASRDAEARNDGGDCGRCWPKV